jgi:ribonuclease HI
MAAKTSSTIHTPYMQDLILFTDGSVHAQSKLGYGAYLAVAEPDLSLEILMTSVQVRRFEQTSSTKLELQTLLWALNDIQILERKVTVYTDSQNIVGLPGRREQMERKTYRSSKNTLLKNYELYQEFYRLIDLIDCDLVKLSGHQPSRQKDDIDRLFTIVDRASRRALREDCRNAEAP